MTTCTAPTTGQVMDSGTIYFPGHLERSVALGEAGGANRFSPRVELPALEHLVTPDHACGAEAPETAETPETPDTSRTAEAPGAPPVLVGAVMGDWDQVDEWGDQSFPASDPPSNW